MRNAIIYIIIATANLLFADTDSLKTYKGKAIEVLGERELWVESDSTKPDYINTSVLSEAAKLSPSLFFTRRSILGLGLATSSAAKIYLFGLGGVPTTQVAILWDGDPLIMGLMGHPVFDAVDCPSGGTVELFRGATPSLSQSAMGGAINIKTKRLANDGLNTFVEGVVGSFKTRRLTGQALIKRDKFDFGFDYSSSSSDGFRNDSRDDYKSERFGGHIGLKTKSDDFLLVYRHDWFKLFDPGTETEPLSNAWYNITRWHSHISWRHSFNRDAFKASYFVHSGHHAIFTGFRSNDLSWGVKTMYTHEFSWGTAGAKLMCIQYGGKVIRGPKTGDFWDTDYQSTVWGKYDSQKFSLKISATMFYRKDFGIHIAPEFEFSKKILGLTSSAKLSNGFRFPCIRELRVFPWSNPSLEPENAWTAQLGFRKSISLLNIKAFIWYTYAENLIKTGYPGHPYSNSGLFRRPGFELSISSNSQASFGFQLGFAHQELGEKRSIGPADHLVGEFFAKKHLIVPLEFRINFEGASGLYANDLPESKLRSFLVPNLELKADITNFLTLRTGVNNIFDLKYYTQAGYPMPPRQIWAQISVNKMTRF